MKKSFYLFVFMLILVWVRGALADDLSKRSRDGYLYIIKEDGTVEITGYVGNGGAISIPEKINEVPVTSIGEHAFLYNESLTEVTVPGSVETVNDLAFENCHSLRVIRFSEGVRSIGYGFAYCCWELQTVSFPDSLTSLGDSPFHGCEQEIIIEMSPGHPYLELVDGVLYSKPDKRLIWYPRPKMTGIFTIPEGTEIIGAQAFGRTFITQIIIPESVHTIREHAFSDSTSLVSVNIPSQVVELDGVFEGCTALRSVTVSKDNPVFEAFIGILFNKVNKTLVYYPPALPDPYYYVPNTVEAIGPSAFENSHLETIFVPGSVHTIGGNAFFHCTNLKSCTISEGVSELGSYVFQRAANLASVTLPDSLSKVGANPFVMAVNLRTISLSPYHRYFYFYEGSLIGIEDMRLISYLYTNRDERFVVPEDVKIIGTRAFGGNPYLKEVVIPEGVEEIGFNVFEECDNLKK
ncbi:MAG: leucine-rich repeat domain-containing protein, partial [Anaerolineaceae bacterium]|nr:leucine-rich repeat domain-containing protein [Anaerolineaceae bacterium]